jgi:hypothetical protein
MGTAGVGRDPVIAIRFHPCALDYVQRARRGAARAHAADRRMHIRTTNPVLPLRSASKLVITFRGDVSVHTPQAVLREVPKLGGPPAH